MNEYSVKRITANIIKRLEDYHFFELVGDQYAHELENGIYYRRVFRESPLLYIDVLINPIKENEPHIKMYIWKVQYYSDPKIGHGSSHTSFRSWAKTSKFYKNLNETIQGAINETN